jgi:hypothetical protein
MQDIRPFPVTPLRPAQKAGAIPVSSRIIPFYSHIPCRHSCVAGKIPVVQESFHKRGTLANYHNLL